jgi:hypothetical protein
MNSWDWISLVLFRTRAIITLTGGTDALQTWATDLLAQPRDGMEVIGAIVVSPEETVPTQWSVPKRYWSMQVRCLAPGSVGIHEVFVDNQEGVWLCFGGALFGWWVYLGPPGAVLDAEFREFSQLHRWGDGIYCAVDG